MPHRNMVNLIFTQRKYFIRQGRMCPPCGNKQVHKWELKTDCNIIWSKNSITGIKYIYVSSLYKPHEHDEHSLKELWSSVEKIPQNSYIWILGDFNPPNMNWSNESHMQIQRTVWHFHWKHNKSQSGTNGQNPHPKQQHTWYISHQHTKFMKPKRYQD